MTDNISPEEFERAASDADRPPYESPSLEFVGNVRSILADGGSQPAFDGVENTTGSMGG